MCHEAKNDWVTVLPTILLGLRACYKEDIKASAAEMLYGETLRIPGEFFRNDTSLVKPNAFADVMRKHISEARPIQTAHHIKKRSFTFKDLKTCTNVFVRVDTVRKPLEAIRRTFRSTEEDIGPSLLSQIQGTTNNNIH